MSSQSWRDLLSPEERRVFEASGYGQSTGFGTRPAVLVIDMNYNFIGDRPEPVLESIKRFPYSCGEVGWTALERIRDVLQAARTAGVPIAYCTGRWVTAGYSVGVLSALNARHDELIALGEEGSRIVNEIAPAANDIVIEKHYPSMFFGTPLISYLHELAIDTLIVTGCTTSGCVRATTVDAYSYNFRVSIPEECVFDRVKSAHDASLLDLDMKYGDVVSTDAVLEYLGSLADRSLDRPLHEELGSRVLSGSS